MPFKDQDTQDFFDGWRASLRDPEQFLDLRAEAYGAGWDAAMRAVVAARKYEEKIIAEERPENERWARAIPPHDYP